MLAAGDETIGTNERSLDDPVPPPPVVLLLVDLHLLAIRGQDRWSTNNPIPTLLWPLLSRLEASSLGNCLLFLGVLLDHTASLPVGECECDEGWACSRWRIGGRWSHLKVEKGRRRALGHSQITDQPDWSTSGFRLCVPHIMWFVYQIWYMREPQNKKLPMLIKREIPSYPSLNRFHVWISGLRLGDVTGVSGNSRFPWFPGTQASNFPSLPVAFCNFPSR